VAGTKEASHLASWAAAIEELRQLLEIPFSTTVWRLRLDPIFDPLRGEPAFQTLLTESPGAQVP